MSKQSERYSSHLPLLKFVAKRIKIETVVEFGCGLYSTCLFLNKSYFPDLKTLYSYETNTEWADIVKNKHLDDSRLKLQIIGRCSEDIYSITPAKCDLVFIDGDKLQRSDAMTLMKEYCDLIIRHDGPVKKKVSKYINKWSYMFKFINVYFNKHKKYEIPSTAVFSNTINLKKFMRKI